MKFLPNWLFGLLKIDSPYKKSPFREDGRIAYMKESVTEVQKKLVRATRAGFRGSGNTDFPYNEILAYYEMT